MRTIVEDGTLKQVERIKNGREGNSVNAVYHEVRESKKPVLTDAERKENLKKIRRYVADLKNPNLDRTDTPKMLITEYAAFANSVIPSLDTYTNEPYIAMYPRMEPEEREYWKEISCR